MSNSNYSDYVGEILCIFFSIANIIVIFQYVIYAFKLRIVYGKLNKGYGFVEDKNRWHYKKMYGIHPSNFDLTQPLETYRF
ncbi:hypothetical protein YQE_09661, partial [Dendroctonus ponderosae]